MNIIKFNLVGKKPKIITDNLEVFNSLRDEYSDTETLFKYKDKQLNKTKIVDKFIITNTGTYPIGLTLELIKYIRINYPLIQIEVDNTILSLIRPLNKQDIPILSPTSTYVYRDYQLNAIKAALSKGRGICLLPTGAGKSLVIFGIIRNINYYSNYKTTLILVPTIQLVKQIYSDFIDYGYTEKDIQMFSGFKPELGNQNIIISNRQWLEEHSQELPNIEIVICDECHQVKYSNKVKKYIQKIETPIKFGLTGTLPEEKIDKWSVIGIFGPIIISKKITELQENKLLANINILPIHIQDNNRKIFKYESLHEARKSFYDEWNYIENYQPYQDLIIKILQKINNNTLVLFDHTEHGQYLFDKYVGNKEFINGEVEIDIREDIRIKMEKENNVMLFGNVKAVGTGINIKNINNIVFVMTGKGVTKIIQSIGRGLRLKEGKTKVNLIDIFFNYKYSEKHFNRRRELYKEFYNIDIHDNSIKKIII